MNTFNVIDLNCGCGSTSLSFLKAGWNIKAAFTFLTKVTSVYDNFIDRNIYPLPQSRFYDIKDEHQTLHYLFSDFSNIEMAVVNYYPFPRKKSLFQEMIFNVEKIAFILTEIINPRLILIEFDVDVKDVYGGIFFNDLLKKFKKKGYLYQEKTFHAQNFVPLGMSKYYLLLYKEDIKIGNFNHPLNLVYGVSDRMSYYEDFLEFIDNEDEYQVPKSLMPELITRMKKREGFEFTQEGRIKTMYHIPANYHNCVGSAVSFNKDGTPRMLTEKEMSSMFGFSEINETPSSLSRKFYQHISTSSIVPITYQIAKLAKNLLEDQTRKKEVVKQVQEDQEDDEDF